MCSRTTPICPGRLGGPSSLPRTPRTFGGCPRPSELLVAAMGPVAWARAVVVASPDAVLVVVEEESAASEEVIAPPPDSSPALGVVAEEVEPRSAPPPPPSSGTWASAPLPKSRRLTGAFGICSLRLGYFVQVLPPELRRSFGPGRHPHCPCAGALAPAPSPFPSRRGPDL
jgi:hypothetical protein